MQISIENKKEPLISIIVPVYNAGPYLARCLDSILSQSYSSLELVIVDDGSTDLSGTIADEYAATYDGKVKCLHQPNEGVTAARMNGVKIAAGEWVGFVDGDDEIEPDMYQRLMNNAVKYQADISHCGYQTIVNGGERVHYFYNTGKVVEQDRITGLRDLLAGDFIEPGLWNKMFRKALFQRLFEENLLDYSVKINEDLMTNYCLFMQSNKSVFEDFCPYHYCSRPSSVSRSNYTANRVFDPVKVRFRILQTVEEELYDLMWSKYLSACCNAYQMIYDNQELRSEALELKTTVVHNMSKARCWGLKEQLKVNALMRFPNAYRKAYVMYKKIFKNNSYE